MFYYLLARLIKVKVRAFMIQTLYHKSCIFPVFCQHLCVPHIFLDGQCYSMTYFELLQMLYPCRTFLIKYTVGCLVFVCLLLSTLKPAFVKRIVFVQKAPSVILKSIKTTLHIVKSVKTYISLSACVGCFHQKCAPIAYVAFFTNVLLASKSVISST